MTQTSEKIGKLLTEELIYKQKRHSTPEDSQAAQQCSSEKLGQPGNHSQQSPRKLRYSLNANKKYTYRPNNNTCKWRHACPIYDENHLHYKHSLHLNQQLNQTNKGRNTNTDRTSQGNASGLQI